MGRPNFQRILEAHGKLPDQLMKDLGLAILDQKADSKLTAIKVPTKPKVIPSLPKVEAVEEKYKELLDSQGRKLVDYQWKELRSKASEDGFYKPGITRAELLEIYSKK